MATVTKAAAVACVLGVAFAVAAPGRSTAAPIDDALDQALDEDLDLDAAPMPAAPGAAAATGVDDGGADPADLAAIASPPIGAVLAAAYATAGLDHDPARGWTWRTRLAGLVPWVTVRTGRDTSWQDADPAVGHETTVEVRATWRLDRLAFDPGELRIATIEASRRRERRRIGSRVIRAYFLWLRARAVALKRPRWASHADEAAAELDSMTDGWFSDAVKAATHRVRLPDR